MGRNRELSCFGSFATLSSRFQAAMASCRLLRCYFQQACKTATVVVEHRQSSVAAVANIVAWAMTDSIPTSRRSTADVGASAALAPA